MIMYAIIALITTFATVYAFSRWANVPEQEAYAMFMVAAVIGGGWPISLTLAVIAIPSHFLYKLGTKHKK